MRLDPRLALAAMLVAPLAAAPVTAAQLTARVIVAPDRLWQCGEHFYANGGSDTYRQVHVLADGQPLGDFDLADPADCAKALDYRIAVPDDGGALITVKVGPYSMDAPLAATARNRVYDVRFFNDAVWAELVDDDAPAWAVSSAEAAAAPAAGSFENTIQLRVAPNRLWQCGENFFSTGGSVGYEFATITLDGAILATYDFAKPADCTRIETVTRALPDGGKAVFGIEVGGNLMKADITARAWARSYWVNFFVDQAWGEVIEK